eukprot:3780770-Pyramimonas_sp.AAC.1
MPHRLAHRLPDGGRGIAAIKSGPNGLLSVEPVPGSHRWDKRARLARCWLRERAVGGEGGIAAAIRSGVDNLLVDGSVLHVLKLPLRLCQLQGRMCRLRSEALSPPPVLRPRTERLPCLRPP